MRKFFIVFLLVLGANSGFADFKKWAKTPPMGWNSWDCYGPTVCESEVKANADYMAKNLKQFGWEYIVVDIRWYIENPTAHGYQKNPVYVIDEWGRYQPAENRFPSAKGGKGFKPLADYIHSKGLKFGIHIMRGVPNIAVERKLPIKNANGITADKIASKNILCRWLGDNQTVEDVAGAQQYYDSIVSLYASWGVDFLKVDDMANPYHKREIEMVRKAIDKCGRKIVLSLSPGEAPIVEREHLKNNANMWRIVPDLWDDWSHVRNLADAAARWAKFGEDGTYPDCDMIPLGRIGIRAEVGSDRASKLAPNEQKFLMGLMAICKSPLMFGGDMPSLDYNTIVLLTNKNLLKINQKSQNYIHVLRDDEVKILASLNPKDSEFYVGIFNCSNAEVENISFVLPFAFQKKMKIIHVLNEDDSAILSDWEKSTFTVNTLKAHSCFVIIIKLK